jgi:hypothetical protein
MIFENMKKDDCIDAIVFGLNRTAQWRQPTAVTFPNEPAAI